MTSSAPTTALFNPGEGRMDSWQLGESADEFVKRLPPLTASGQVYDWIWVYNPYARSNGKTRSPVLTAEYEVRGRQLLAESLQKRKDIQAKDPGKAKGKGTTTQQLNDEAKLLQQRITDLAVETNVLSGKWMLFPGLDDVSRIWRLIVDAVINNRLGSSAKVAPDNGEDGERLICVYTKDFRDKEDILRVLQELVSMGVVGSGRPIHYKSDSYTLIGVYRQTADDYGLRASLHSSHKMLSEAKLAKTAAPQRKQSTLDGYAKARDSINWRRQS
ncbi:DUF1917-domain-containing protein [Byssothecium circinans]|uniref:DUF1917-domain-containing protein n=1 Tax=Byssothecium circinans TaxID=147558 RepID=A0A6A5UQT0_9PLEO|nr:DUF1917-domain-containing protein [Byssothecium circinans]